MSEHIAQVVGAACRKLRRREARGPGHALAGVDVATVGVRIAVLMAQHAAAPPPLEESARKDAVLARAVAIEVVGALPGRNGSEMRRTHRGHEPLARGVIGNAEQADLSAAPGLRG